MTTIEPAGEPQPEPQNVAEAIAQRQAAGVPAFIEANTDDDDPTGEPAEPTAPVAGDGEVASGDPVAAPVAGEVDPYAEYGGKDEVANAVVIARALRTERGTKLLIAQGMEALGFSPEQVTAALAGGAVAAPAEAAPAAPADPLAGISDEDVVTGAELKTVVSSAVAQAVAQMQAAVQQGTDPVRQAFEADRQARATAVVDGTIVELLGTEGNPESVDRAIAADVIRQAEKYIEEGNWDPTHIRQAIVRGHTDVQAELNRRFEAYQAKKKAVKDATPTPVGNGSTAGAEAAPDPENLAEAREILKATGFFK